MKERYSRVRAKREERNKNKEKGVRKEGLDFLVQLREKIREKNFGAAKEDKESRLGVEYV